ncbi:AMP-binding protein [Ramlibacter sp.]|uniref:AMP-binding protein n=1 Tax=Ramlibacter sp. TaxID=1917967 RepID=UPI002A63C09E|nr:long-chain acyl-CoA synthetase [Ramlibacter sp.]
MPMPTELSHGTEPGVTPGSIALEDGQRAWTLEALKLEVSDLAARLERDGARVVATLLDNSPAWIVADRAAAAAGLVHVPLPLFFTPQQISHALQAAGVDTVLTLPRAAAQWPQLPSQACSVAGQELALVRVPSQPVAMPANTSKVTFTSGTTGAPKGVCLTEAGMRRVAAGLLAALEPLGIRRHLCALPFAVLLENIAGVLAPLARGVTCIALPLAQVGLRGSSSFDAAGLHAAVLQHRPNSIILLPQMLRAWADHLQQSGQRAPECLRFVAVGGSAVGRPLLARAWSLGIPAYEGYGLSEGGSVQTLNLPGAHRLGSAGQPLPQALVRIGAEDEIEIGGSLFAGYLGDSTPVPAWWPTGDLGSIAADGFLHVRGRRDHVLITGYGRNVSPEWVETALRSESAIAQAVVLGDGQPGLGAVLWPAHADASDEQLQQAVDAANGTLPDYARIGPWVRARAAFDFASGMATANGRPQRAAVLVAHASELGFGVPPPSTPSQEISMTFYERLVAETADARQGLLGAAIIQACLRGEVSLPSYLAFLREAFHHVRHTVPLMHACQAALPVRNRWLEEPLDEYVQEEIGHEQWILDDIAAAGGDVAVVRAGPPDLATELMVAYAYDTIVRRNPLGFFGMVYVLEGTSVSLALMAADRIQKALQLPDRAFTYLRSHGTLDNEHVGSFALLMNRIQDPRDQADIIHAARAFFKLYGDVFRSLPLAGTGALPTMPDRAAAGAPA